MRRGSKPLAPVLPEAAAPPGRALQASLRSSGHAAQYVDRSRRGGLRVRETATASRARGAFATANHPRWIIREPLELLAPQTFVRSRAMDTFVAAIVQGAALDGRRAEAHTVPRRSR